jgi:hypothetical protein
MKLLKKFELPEKFEKDFNEEVMERNGKVSLSHFQENNHKFTKRERANTFQDNYSYSRSNIIY